jgi:hypothetical protein
MVDFGNLTRGRLQLAGQRGRLSGLNRAQLSQRTGDLIFRRREEELQKRREETARRRQRQSMAIGAGLGAVGGLAAAPFAAAAIPALTTAGAVAGGVGMGAAAGASMGLFGQNVTAGGMQTAATAFDMMPVDWGDVLSGKVFGAGLVDPTNIPADALGEIPGGAGTELLGGLPAKVTASPAAKTTTMQAEPTAEAALGKAFERPALANLAKRRLRLEDQMVSGFAA